MIMENENYDEILEMIVTELTERGIREQREENPEIDNLIQEQTEMSVQVQECLDKLDDEVKEILVRYYEQAESIADEQIKYLYLQGAKDCVRLLKSLGII